MLPKEYEDENAIPTREEELALLWQEATGDEVEITIVPGALGNTRVYDAYTGTQIIVFAGEATVTEISMAAIAYKAGRIRGKREGTIEIQSSIKTLLGL